MTRTSGACVLFLAVCWNALADEPARATVVKKLAEDIGDATLKEDFAKVIDHTLDTLVKELGGREKAIKAASAMFKQMKAEGLKMKAFKVGEPGDLLGEGSHTFVVVPTTLELAVPGGNVIGKSYLLGISPDMGKTWRFADGSGLDDKDFRDRVLPKLPAKLKLPEKGKFEFIKDK